MSYSNRFHLFNFTPTKLNLQRVTIEKTFSGIEENVLKIRAREKLPALLHKIRNTDWENLHSLIHSLRKIDIQLVIFEYPFHEESADTKKKINKILAENYSSLIGKTAWDLFQQDINDPFLQELLQLSFQKDESSFLGIEAQYLQPFSSAYKQDNSLIENLVSFLKRTQTASTEVFKKWKIKKLSILETVLLTQLYNEELYNDRIIQRDGVTAVINFFQLLPSQDYKKLLKKYIESRDHKTFNFSILEQLIHRLMDPREKEEEWGFLTLQACQEVKKWLLANELRKFFGQDNTNERFEYWKRFIDYMENVTPLKSPFVAFIYFPNFVVVEFGKIGASYFYDKSGFTNFILPRTKEYRFRYSKSDAMKESRLKDQNPQINETPLFITRLLHKGNWQQRFNNEMSKLLLSTKEKG